METRPAWLITCSGAPYNLAFGNHKNPSSEADPAIRDWASALNEAQEVDPAYDATMTAWRSAPAFAVPGLLTHPSSGAALSGRTLTIAGVSWNLDDSGRSPGIGMENLPPDGTIVDQLAAVAFAEALGGDLEFVEAGTLRRVRVWSTQDPIDPFLGGFGSALYKQSADGLVVRADA